ncbi:hypothetical protein [Crocosphaera sp. XPORK-15E]|uniref:hypothetical protein n=1 Tax=Crocosphaera sp. XPORK-15E TaxID=3110247 RepID=UPI002B217E2B|nr:hypothetical protein [Crocosphaera sp. XPORK-15E]MEA5534681.1 hypothetical protein [Crocosphaera sp. XPORK-15E]
MTHDELKKTALQKPEVKAEYEALGTEFERLHQILQERQDAKLTQTQIDEYIEMKPPQETVLP